MGPFLVILYQINIFIMEGLTISNVYDMGPNNRLKLEIDCEIFPNNAYYHGFTDKYVPLIKNAMAEYDTNQVSLCFKNFKYDGEDINVDISGLFYVFDDLDIIDVFIYLPIDFITYLNIGDIPYTKVKYITFITGEYDEKHATYPGTDIKPVYRQSFNQKIWQSNKFDKEYTRGAYRDVTSELDPLYNKWKQTIKI